MSQSEYELEIFEGKLEFCLRLVRALWMKPRLLERSLCELAR